VSNWNTHSRNPELPPENSKVMYLFANPYDTVLSYFRRAVWNDESNCQSSNNSWLEHHCRNLEGDSRYFNKPENRVLENFLKDDYDPFLLSEHIEKWMSHENRNYELWLMRYESLSINGINPFIEYWNLPKDMSFNFKIRNSDWKSNSVEIQQGLERKYGSLFEIYYSLPLVSKLSGRIGREIGLYR
jgi:hypothetical protein